MSCQTAKKPDEDIWFKWVVLKELIVTYNLLRDHEVPPHVAYEAYPREHEMLVRRLMRGHEELSREHEEHKGGEEP